MNVWLVPESQRAIVQRMNTLLPTAWHSAIPPEHGKGELNLACDEFMVSFSNDGKQVYQVFKDSKIAFQSKSATHVCS